MRKTCPHCGVDFTVELGSQPGSKWAFARCYECHGLTLIDTRRSAPGAIELPPLPSFMKKPKAEPKVVLPKASPKIEEPRVLATAAPLPIPAPILDKVRPDESAQRNNSMLPAPLPDLAELDALFHVDEPSSPNSPNSPNSIDEEIQTDHPASPRANRSRRLYARQVAVVLLFGTSIFALRWALTPHSGDVSTDVMPQAVHEARQANQIHDAVEVAKAAEIPAPAQTQPVQAAPVAPVAPVASAVAQAQAALPADTTILKLLNVQVKVIATSATLRKGPGTQFAKVASARSQEQLAVRRRQGDWLEVDLGSGGTAWVRNDLVRVL
jgi:hypothetical protein